MKKYFTIRRIITTLLVLLLAIQFYRPEPNIGNEYSDNDVFHFTSTPDDVRQILVRSCFDCHSNNTHYPWYSVVQPVGMWLQQHVNEGKEELNFSDFKSYSPKRQKHKMEEIVELVREGEMPLPAYTMIHGNAKLTEAQKQKLIHWAESVYQGIQVTED